MAGVRPAWVFDRLQSFLTKYGYKVLEAQSAGDALLYSEQHPAAIDLLLTSTNQTSRSASANTSSSV